MHVETAAAAAAAAPVAPVLHVAHDAALSPLIQLASGAAARGSEPSGGAHDDGGAPKVVKARASAPSRRQTEVAECAKQEHRASILAATRASSLFTWTPPTLLPPTTGSGSRETQPLRAQCSQGARFSSPEGAVTHSPSALVPLPARACSADAQAVHDHEAARAVDGGGALAVLGGAEAARPCVAEDRRFGSATLSADCSTHLCADTRATAATSPTYRAQSTWAPRPRSRSGATRRSSSRKWRSSRPATAEAAVVCLVQRQPSPSSQPALTAQQRTSASHHRVRNASRMLRCRAKRPQV